MAANPRTAGAPAAADTVAAFVVHDGRILLLREPGGRWAAVWAEAGAAPLDRAYAALAEQIRLTADQIARSRVGEPFLNLDPASGARGWIYPFLFEIDDSSGLRFARDDVRRRWVWPGELDALDTVPGLGDALRRVYP